MTIDTHVGSSVNSVKDVPSKGVLAQVGDNAACALSCHDGAEDALDLVPSLLNGMDVALGWAAFETRTYDVASVKWQEHEMSRLREPWKVHAAGQSEPVERVKWKDRVTYAFLPASNFCTCRLRSPRICSLSSCTCRTLSRAASVSCPGQRRDIHASGAPTGLAGRGAGFAVVV